MKKFFMAMMAVAAIAFVGCKPQNEPDKDKDKNEQNNSNEQQQPQAKAADITIAFAVDQDWFQIADVCIYDSVGSAAAKQEELVDLYTTWDLGISFAEFRTQKFDACTWVFKGYLTTKKFEPNDAIKFRCELKLKENYMEILQAMEPGSQIKLAVLRAFANQDHAPEYMCFGTTNGVILEVDGLLKIMAERDPNYLENMAKQCSEFLSGVFVYDGFTAGKM